MSSGDNEGLDLVSNVMPVWEKNEEKVLATSKLVEPVYS